MNDVRVVASRFETQDVAGTGGMGVVYRARDRADGTTVALKLVRGAASEAAERFEREARTLAELRHPGIVRYVAHGTTPDGELWLAMEWLEGEDLEGRLARGRLELGECIELGRRVAAALAVAHEAAIVHRDIKPSNLFLPSGAIDRVKILDFGIARVSGPLAARTQSGLILGTPGYMAPEQARGERSLDARVDVFALGSVLFECITGRPAFAGEHVMAILTKILFEEAPRVSELVAGVPDAFDSLVARMLAKQPASRPANGNALAVALADLEVAGSGSEVVRAETPSSRSITGKELSLVSLVLAREPRSPGPERPDDTAKMLLADGALATGELEAAVATYGGRLETMADGGLAVALPGRGNATDAAAQAARCALTLRALVPHAAMALVTGLGEISGHRLVGEAIDRGAHLLGGAGAATRPGLVLLDEVTTGLIETRFEIGPDRALVRELPETEQPRTLMGKTTPCVGRDREIATLVGIFESCVTEPAAHAVLVTGTAGVGKSRLRLEVLGRLGTSGDEASVWRGRCDPIRAGSPFALLADSTRRVCQLREGDPLILQRRAIETRVARSVAGPEAARVAEFLGELVGVPFPDADSVQLRAARQDAALMSAQVERAWETFVAAECSSRPLVLALEDVHWADPPSLRAVASTLRSLCDRPLLVLAFGRPEVEELASRFWADRRLDHLRLGGLGRGAVQILVGDVLGSRATTDVVERLVERAQGNAFFLEELIRAEAQGGVGTAPATVLAMIRGRLDALGPSSRLVLRAASIFGRTFWRGAVAAILGGAVGGTELDAVLADLVEREIVARRRSDRFPGDAEWCFRHDLLREAAYGMLTDADRAVGHGLAGDWLERTGERDAVTLAEHFERGNNAASAVRWYVVAAEDALRASDPHAVIARAERGARAGAAGEALGALRALEAEAYRSLDQHELGREAGLEALGHLPRGTRRRYLAIGALASALGCSRQYDALVALAEELLEPAPAEALLAHVSAAARAAMSLVYGGRYAVAEALLRQIERLDPVVLEREPGARASVHLVRATRAQFAGDLEALVSEEQAAIAAYEASGNHTAALEEKNSLGWAYGLLGAHERAEAVLRDAIGAGQRLGLSQVELAAGQNLGAALTALERLDEAAEILRHTVQRYSGQGYGRMEGGTRAILARTLLCRCELDEALEQARRAANLLSGSLPLLPLALATLAQVHLARRETSDAVDAARRAMDVLESLGTIEEAEMLTRLTFALSLEAAGDEVASRDALAQARERLLAVADRIRDPALRQSFLERVPENAQILALSAS